MEIDLIANHKHKDETLYVECKAKEKVTSDELSKFCFNALHKKASAGYFFRTKELESQAGGYLRELQDDSRYRHLTFFEPDDIIKILSDAKLIFEPSAILSSHKISKRIFAVTYFGDFLIYIVNNSSLVKTHFLLFNSKSNEEDIAEDKLNILKNRIDDLQDLDQMIVGKEKNETTQGIAPIHQKEIETISEVQESTNWYDYLPASSKHFVGRDKIRNQIFNFFLDVSTCQTSKRIFYLTGKSGWGKSSLIAELRGRSRNKFYKNRFYVTAIDTRSATSSNFVALAFDKLLKKSISSGFLKLPPLSAKVSFTSNFDLLSSDSVNEVLSELSRQHKVLVLIFDQFEDVFRKQSLFKSFYKFLSDVTDAKSNLVIGFSWKTEITIPIDNEAYHYWQQAKEQAVNFMIPEFGSKEVNGIVNQLEASTSKIGNDLKRRIVEGSQGLPWLTKKLCIHLYHQIKSGIPSTKLIDDNLNIVSLFKTDLEGVTPEELAALKYIAKRAFDGNLFDITEFGDNISEKTVEALRDKRLIIRSGANYIVYWDIFRDYLVNNEVQQIGESFIIRQPVKVCFEIFSLFNHGEELTIGEIKDKRSKTVKRETIENVLIELRNLGLVQKVDGQDKYRIAHQSIETSKNGFVKFISDKFLNYTPYLKLIKIDKKLLTANDVIEVFKDVFKGYDFKHKTWSFYAKNLISWLAYSQLSIKNKLEEPRKGRRFGITTKLSNDHQDFILRGSFSETLKSLALLKTTPSKITSGGYRDLLILGIVNEQRDITDFGRKIINSDIEEVPRMIRLAAVKLPKVKQVADLLTIKSKLKAKELLSLLPSDFFNAEKESSKLIYASKILTWVKSSSR